MILHKPRWEALGNHFNLLVSITDNGKPKVVRVVTTQMLSAISEALKRGAKVKLTGEVTQSRKRKKLRKTRHVSFRSWLFHGRSEDLTSSPFDDCRGNARRASDDLFRGRGHLRLRANVPQLVQAGNKVTRSRCRNPRGRDHGVHW